MPFMESDDTSQTGDATEPGRQKDALADPELRRVVAEFVRRRVRAEDVEDVVQTVLCEALAAAERPADRSELRQWLIGVARHKVADVHRKASREPLAEPADIEASPAPIEARALAHWAEKQAASVRDAQETLRWMAREGEGEKLESIAAEANLPPTRVRQRVSRMRRWMKERWLQELALVAAIAVAAFVAYRLLRGPKEVPEAVVPEAPPVPSAVPEAPPELERARALRAEAFQKCDHEDWRGCLDGLDRAAELDPAGDGDEAVRAARDRAKVELDKIERDRKLELEKKRKVAPPPKTQAPPTLGPEPTKQAPLPKGKAPAKPAPNGLDPKLKKSMLDQLEGFDPKKQGAIDAKKGERVTK